MTEYERPKIKNGYWSRIDGHLRELGFEDIDERSEKLLEAVKVGVNQLSES